MSSRSWASLAAGSGSSAASTSSNSSRARSIALTWSGVKSMGRLCRLVLPDYHIGGIRQVGSAKVGIYLTFLPDLGHTAGYEN